MQQNLSNCHKMKKNRLMQLLLTCYLLIFSVLYTKGYGMEKLDIISHQLNKINSLPSNNIRCITQDEEGYLWLGTLNGLYRFDGYRVQKFTRTHTGNKSLMKNNRISKLEQWRDGQIAVTFPRQEVIGFNTRYGLFEPLKDSLAYAQNSCLKQNMIIDNRGNYITISNKEDIVYQNIKTNSTLILKAIPLFLWKLSSDIKLKVVTDRRGLIWISTAGGGITVYDSNGNMLKRITANTSERLIPSNYITDMIEDRNGRILICEQWHGITILSIEEKNMNVVTLGSKTDIANAKEVKVLTNIPKGDIIVANDLGKVFTMNTNGELETIKSLPTDVEYLCITTDEKGHFIAGTRNNGLYTEKGFLTHSSNSPSIASNRIDCILTDRKGRIWICNVYGMVDMLERKGEKWMFKHFFTQFHGLEVKSMICDHNGKIWMATNIGIFCFNPENLIKDSESYIRYPLSVDDEEIRVTCLMEDSRHAIWAGTSGWGVFVRAENKDFVQFSKQSGVVRSINAIIEDTEHNIWLAGSEGALCYSPNCGSTFKLYSQTTPLRNIFNSHCAATMSDGRVVLGSLDGALITSKKMIQQTGVEQILRISEIKVNDTPLQYSDKIELKHDQNTLTFFFSDLSFNSSRSTYYSYLLEGLAMQWSEPSTTNFANFNALQPGHYIFRVKIIDSNLKAHEQSIAFTILLPWWQTWWFRLFILLIIIAIATHLYVHYRREAKLKQTFHDEQLLTEYRVKFFTNISHEFRTPLTLIQGAMDKIILSEKKSEQLQPLLYVMQRNVARMKRLIEQLLEFRRMETGNMELHLEQVEIVEMLKEIFLSFHELSDRRLINYKFFTTHKQLIMYADRSYIDKIVYNLLSNAFKYTPVGGEISMKLSVEGKTLVVTVQDTGIGVPEKKREKLFERFNCSKANTNSIGIGLNLTAELVKKHQGTIIYKPVEEGGSVFQFTLPIDKTIYKAEDFLQYSELMLQQEYLNSSKIQISRPMPARPMNNKTVLIVEDDYDIQDFLQQELLNYFHVKVANNGVEAIELIEENMPDLMITDIRMPHMNGFQLLTHIRKSNYRYLPVIMLTAIDTVETELKSIKYGADIYLSKPFDMRVLVAHCATLIQKFNDNEKTSTIKQPTQKLQQDTNITKEVPPTTKMIITNEHDRKFLDHFNAYIQKHINDKNLNINLLSETMGYGRSNFYRKVTALVGCSPKEYIRKLRIERAAELLRSSDTITVAEVAYMTGFNTPQYFSTVFRTYYNMLPSEYQKSAESCHSISTTTKKI